MDEHRLKKVAQVRKAGGIPYAASFKRTHKLKQIADLKEDDDSSIAGRIVLLRRMGKMTFITLQDHTGRGQIAFKQDELGDESYKEALELLDLGDFIGITGERFTTNKGEPTILVKEWELLSKALRQPPEKWHGIADQETTWRQRYLDLMSNRETFERFHFRSQFVRKLREFYWKHDFTEVETPVLVNASSGALATPFITHHNAYDMDVYLRIAAGETFQKECLVGGFDRTFEVARCFRNEGLDPSHLQDFTMVEHYAAYWDYEQNMKFTEEMLSTLIQELLGTMIIKIPDRDGNLVEVDFSPPWPRLSIRDAIDRDCGISLDECTTADALRTAMTKKNIKLEVDIKSLGYGNLIDQLYKKVSRPSIVQPTFLTNHPVELSPLARLNDDNPAITDRFQLVVGGWEVVNAYSELVDPVDQAERFDAQSTAKAGGDTEAHGKDDEFVKALSYGCPPCSGLGMGIDRMTALLTQQTNIREVVLFPIMKPDTELSSKEQEERYRSKKFIVIGNSSMDSGTVANAIGQLGIAIGGHINEQLFDARVLHDADEHIHYTDSLFPMTNLAGTHEQMAEFAEKCYESGIQFFDFSDIMRKAHTDTQMKKWYLEKKTKDVGYIAVGALVPTDFEQDFLSQLPLYGTNNTEDSTLKEDALPSDQSSTSSPKTMTDTLLLQHAEYGHLLPAAHGLLEEHTSNTKAHLIATGAAMEALAKKFGGHTDTWKVAGMLHDLDWDSLDKDFEKHCGEELEEMLASIEAPKELLGDIRAHYAHRYGEEYPLDTQLRKCLYCVDELTGFIIAVTLVRPSKKLEDVQVKSVKKKLKDKTFAAQVDREQIRSCDELLGMELDELIEITLEAMKGVADDLGL